MISTFSFDYKSGYNKHYVNAHLEMLKGAVYDVNLGDLFLIEESSPYYREARAVLGYAYLTKIIRIDVNNIDEAFDNFLKAKFRFFLEYLSMMPTLSKKRRARMLKYYKIRFDKKDKTVYHVYGKCLICDGQTDLGLEVLAY